MPPNVRLTQGPLQVADRTANIHPEHWQPEVTKYSPLALQTPITTVLDRMRQGKKVNSRTTHYWEKPYNPLSGAAEDVYVDAGFNTAYTSGAGEGSVLVIKPTTDDQNRVMNLRRHQQVELWSAATRKAVKAEVVGVETSGAVGFTVKLLQADPNNVMASANIKWQILQGTSQEKFELGDATNEHETEFFNYIYTDSQAFEVTRDELREHSRITENLLIDKEMDALCAINKRREFNVLEGWRRKEGTRYAAGGLRFFLDTYESQNIVDWTTDTEYSASTDSVLGGTLQFIQRVVRASRKWEPIGSRATLVTSAAIRGLISEAVHANGHWEVKYGKNKWGLDCTTLLSMETELDVVENPLFNHSDAYARRAYLIRFENMKRHEPEQMNGTELARSKGLQRVPWSKFKKMDGHTFTSTMKGAWLCEETYSFNHLASNFILENLGYDKAA